MNGISTHIKLAPESPVSLPPREDTARRQTAVYESGSGPSPDTESASALTLTSQPLKL